MKKNLLSLILIVVSAWGIGAQEKNFYKNALKEGRSLYQERQFDQAVRSLEIARFGLLDKKDLVREINLLLGLAYFKQDKFKDAADLLESEKQRGLKVAQMIDLVGKNLKDDFLIMYRTLFPEKIGSNSTSRPGDSPALRKSFETVFQKTLVYSEQRQTEGLKKGIARLKDLNSADPRILFLEGVLAVMQKKNSEAVRYLKTAVKTVQAEFSGEARYYYIIALARSGLSGRALQQIDQLQDPEKTGKLANLKNSLELRRKKYINILAESFSGKTMKQAMASFPGDTWLGHDVVTRARINGISSKKLAELIDSLADHENALNRDFYLVCAGFFRQQQNYSRAARCFEKAGISERSKKEELESLYALGEMYFKMGRKKRAEALIRRVILLEPEFRPALDLLRLLSKKK